MAALYEQQMELLKIPLAAVDPDTAKSVGWAAK